MQAPYRLSPSHSPKQASVFPLRDSPHNSPHRPIEDIKEPPKSRTPSPEPVKDVERPIKKEQPLDLTCHRREDDEELLISKTEPKEHIKDTIEEKPKSPPISEEAKVVEEHRPRVHHPFFRISELLKDTTSSSVSNDPPHLQLYLIPHQSCH